MVVVVAAAARISNAIVRRKKSASCDGSWVEVCYCFV